MTGADPHSVRTERAPLPEVLARPAHGRVLAFAPHADDEVLGCGGTLALHAAGGDPVRAVVAFDGTADRALFAEDPLRRRTEARRGGRRLGVRDYRFLGLPEGHRPSAEELEAGVLRLVRELEDFRPDVVYAPWNGEHHLDHSVLARAVRIALCATGFRGEAWGYEVWTPLTPSRVVDVTAAFELKLGALCAHASQLRLADLLHAASGLGAQRSLYLPDRARQGEAFAPLVADFPADSEELATLRRVLALHEQPACTSV